MTRVAITGDWHIHPHSGSPAVLRSCIEAAEWAITAAAAEGCRAMLHLGDVYEDRECVHIVALHNVHRLMRLSRDLGMRNYVLLGNHDMFNAKGSAEHSVSALTELATVIDRPTSTEIFGRRFDWMPYTDSPAADLEKHFPANGRKGAILMGHFGVSDAVTNGLYGTRYVARNETSEQHARMFDGWDAGWLGHFHKRQVIPFAQHVKFQGSLQQLTMAEAGDEKGFSVLDLETMEETFVRNPVSPTYHVYTSMVEVRKSPPPKGQHLRVKLSQDDGLTRAAAKKELAAYEPISCVVSPPEYVSPVDADALASVIGASTEKRVSDGMDVMVLMNDHAEVARRYAKSCAMPHDELGIGLDIINSVAG